MWSNIFQNTLKSIQIRAGHVAIKPQQPQPNLNLVHFWVIIIKHVGRTAIFPAQRVHNYASIVLVLSTTASTWETTNICIIGDRDVLAKPVPLTQLPTGQTSRARMRSARPPSIITWTAISPRVSRTKMYFVCFAAAWKHTMYVPQPGWWLFCSNGATRIV